MTFDEVLVQIQDLLQREKRVSYQGLKRRFDLDDEYLEDLKEELSGAKGLAALRATGGTAEIYNWFTEGFDTNDLQEAKALLEELNH